MPESVGDRTRHRLLDAAEQLMAEHGIEGAELDEIRRRAGQRNRSAIAYHFGDRQGLLLALGARRRAPVNRARNRLLDRLEQHGHVTIPNLATALVRPPAADLRTPGGRSYLIVLAEAATRLGSTNLLRADRTHVDSTHRLAALLLEQLTGPLPRRRRTINRAILVMPVLLADIARDINNDVASQSAAARQVNEIIRFISDALT